MTGNTENRKNVVQKGQTPILGKGRLQRGMNPTFVDNPAVLSACSETNEDPWLCVTRSLWLCPVSKRYLTTDTIPIRGLVSTEYGRAAVI
jgi:hypothetical protein